MTSIRVRLALLADEVLAAAILAEYCDALAIVARDSPADVRTYLTAPGGLWLAERGAQTIGCVALRPFGNAIGEVKRLYVRPAYRAQGVADALLDALEAGARERGVRELYLDTHDGLLAATRFYARRGYARRARYNDNPQATIFMQRRLD